MHVVPVNQRTSMSFTFFPYCLTPSILGIPTVDEVALLLRGTWIIIEAWRAVIVNGVILSFITHRSFLYIQTRAGSVVGGIQLGVSHLGTKPSPELGHPPVCAVRMPYRITAIIAFGIV